MNEIKENLIKMATDWQCEKNEMIIMLINQYDSQYQLVEKLLGELNQDDTTYVEKKEDRYRGIGYTLNPLLKEIPKITESANKTASLIMKTITAVGIKPEIKMESALTKFLEDDEDDDDGTDEE